MLNLLEENHSRLISCQCGNVKGHRRGWHFNIVTMYQESWMVPMQSRTKVFAQARLSPLGRSGNNVISALAWFPMVIYAWQA